MICHQVKVTNIRHFCGFAFVALKFALFACFFNNLAKKNIWCEENDIVRFVFRMWTMICLLVCVAFIATSERFLLRVIYQF